MNYFSISKTSFKQNFMVSVRRKKREREKIRLSFHFILNMTNNSKNFSNISYSLKIGSSTYSVVGCRRRSLRHDNTYFLAEKAAIRSRSASASTRLLPHIQHSKSHRQSTSSERRPKISTHRGVTFDSDSIVKQEPKKSNQVHHRYVQSKSKNTKQITDKLTRSRREGLIDPLHQETTEGKSRSITPNHNERNESLPATTNNQTEEIIRLLDEQKRSLIHVLEQYAGPTHIPSVDTIKQIVLETLQSQQRIYTREFEHTLTETVQQELQKVLSKNEDKSQSNTLDSNIINQLQEMITQTIEKYISSTIEDNNITLNYLFAEQKQALVETLTQQSSTSSTDLIKQVLTDALSEYHSPSFTTNSATNLTNPRQPNIEIKITTDTNQTRIDAAFRLQRDTIVANRYFRDSIRQWHNVRSISSLIQNIQECSTNDIENAWLLFCWIGQNIRFDLNCQNHSAEYVFQNRTGSSHGFVNLYHECCSLLNISSFQINGYVKQDDNFKQICHVWNGIILEQYTYLIDPTWGAGAGDNTNEFEDFYFLILPEEFIYTHYSKDYQLLQPKISQEEFLSLPLMKSNYYRLNLNLLSPKQGFNQTNENIFKISLKTPAYVDLIASLQINGVEYPLYLHTLCQRDIFQMEVINCFFAPPTNGLYQMIIYAKANNEMKYQETIDMRLNVLNLSQAITFPMRSQSFLEYRCILIQPFRRLIQENECLYIHMKIPDARAIKIKNGNESILPNINEYQNGFLKKEVLVRGDIRICVRWTDQTEKLYTICVFNMI